jgi:hypothetical protein
VTSSKTPSLAIAVVALVLGALAVAFVVRWDPAVPKQIERVSPGTEPNAIPSAPRTGTTELQGVDRTAEVSSDAVSVVDTTVAYPLVFELDLVADHTLPAVPAGPPLGSGATARLAGRIADERGEPVRATVAFVAGPNDGRMLTCDALGRFAANDLLPGIDVVEITGPGILGSRREVRLRQEREFLLNIGYGRPATVQGRIVDEEGEPIGGAHVRLDGLATTTDENGTFFYIEVASGRCLFEVHKEGYVAYRTELPVASASRVEPGTLAVVLRRPASLRVVLRPDIGGPEPALVLLTPARANFERSFPWQRVNPLYVTGETPLVVNDLPEGPVHVRVYRSGAIMKPDYRQVHLNCGVETEVIVGLTPAPVVAGVVLGPDGAVPGAIVTISAADVPRATQRHFTTADQLWLEEVLPVVPAARTVVTADASGRFRATSWSDLSPFRLLEAVSPDGELVARRMLGPEDDDQEFELLLEPREPFASANVVASMPGRFQALPVDVFVNGVPRRQELVASNQNLVVDDLVPGVYRVRATWQGDRIVFQPEFLVDATTRLEILLPQEAIDGQDEDTWHRLGKPYPDVPEARARAEAKAAEVTTDG